VRGDAIMRVLFTDQHEYMGRVKDGYSFQDEYGDVIITHKAKLVDKATDEVIFFLDTGREDIQYSFKDQRRTGVVKPDLKHFADVSRQVSTRKREL
jgi:hypothetical protein